MHCNKLIWLGYKSITLDPWFVSSVIEDEDQDEDDVEELDGFKICEEELSEEDERNEDDEEDEKDEEDEDNKKDDNDEDDEACMDIFSKVCLLFCTVLIFPRILWLKSISPEKKILSPK